MKHLLLVAGLVFGGVMVGRADVMLWMVDHPTITGGDGSVYSIWEPVTGADGKSYLLNGARVAAKDAAGNVSYLSVYDTQTGQFDPSATVVGLNSEKPAVLPVWAGYLPDDPTGWSFAIELGVIDIVDDDLVWTGVASSGYETIASLQPYITANVVDMPGYVPWSPNAYNAPEPASGLLALVGAALLALRRRRPSRAFGRRSVVLSSGLFAPLALVAAPVVSSNIHGLVRIDPTTTNTIVSVPWRGYTADGTPTRPLAADRLVSPIGLTPGDLLLQVTNEVAYASWSLEAAADGSRAWQPVMTASRGEDAFGRTRNEIITHEGHGTLARGRGIWLVRQCPLASDGTANPVYLYGQWTLVGEVVEIPGIVRGGTRTYGGYDTCTYTMLANPDCRTATVVNDLVWDAELVGATDTIVIPRDRAAARVLFWEEPSDAAPDGRWYETKTVQVNKFVKRTIRDYEAAVPAGVGFWYVRRAAEPLYVVWPGGVTRERAQADGGAEGEEE